MKSADIITLTTKTDLAASIAPASVNDHLSLVHRGIFEGIKLGTMLKSGQHGNMSDVLSTSVAELWNENLTNEEREAALTGLFLGALAVHDLEVEL